MKSESLASCRCRVNISGGSEIAWINVECNGDSLFAVLRDSCYSSVTNLLLESNWRDSERIETAALPKNLFIRLAVVTLTADGRVNNIIFASYLAGNRPLICKCITVPSSTALTECSQTLSNDTRVSRILSASVWDRLWVRKGLLLRYTALLNCVVNLLS